MDFQFINLQNNTRNTLKLCYQHQIISYEEYIKIGNNINTLPYKSLSNIYEKLNYLLENNKVTSKPSTNILNQHNQILQEQQRIIQQQQQQISQIVNFFSDIDDNDNPNNRYQTQQNQRLQNISVSKDYLPRMNTPQIQNKQPRNNFEIEYQERFQQRTNFNNDMYQPQIQQEIQQGITNKSHQHHLIHKNDYDRDNFYQQEELKRKQFEKTQYLREKMYQEKARKRRMEFENSIQMEINQDFNPYQILQCQPNSDIEIIKKNYKILAMKYHPDRPNGDTQKFQMITKAYLYLIEEYKKKTVDKNFNELKNDFQNFQEKQDNTPKPEVNKDNFNIKLFNKIFMENHISEPNEEGYQDWYKNQDEKEIENTPVFSDKFNINVFNTMFENTKNDNNCQEIVKHVDPKPTNINNELAYSNLGEGGINDFSGISSNNQLNYTDLKLAHTKTKLINTTQVKPRKQYKSVDEFEKDRENVPREMSPEELIEYQRKKKQNEIEEFERRKRLERYDNRHFENYERVNRLMLPHFNVNNQSQLTNTNNNDKLMISNY